MKNPFSKCGRLRQRFKNHKLTTKYARNFGAFDWGDSVFGESYNTKQSHDHECSEATAERQNASSEERLSITETIKACFNSTEDFISNFDPVHISSTSAKDLTNNVKRKNYFLLNILYADDFVEDKFLLEIMKILLATKESFKELQEVKKYIYEQDGNRRELQEWIDAMSKKISGAKTRTFSAWQGRIPGSVGRPVIGGSTMHKWLQNKP